MLIDTHCHLNCLDLSVFDGSLDRALDAAKEQGVGRFICIGLNMTDAYQVLDIATKYDTVYGTVGIHPNEDNEPTPTADQLIAMADHPKVVAIGECGLDYFHQTVSPDIQRNRFAMQCDVAKQLDKPLVIHMRETGDEVLDQIEKSGVRQGVLHCFTGTQAQAERAIDLGFKIGISGIITFKNAQSLRDTVSALPLTALLVETDSPYLSPHPFRGKPNHPAMVYWVAEQLASLFHCSIETIAKQTTETAERLFKLA